jgi:hypothetical protein
MNDAYADLTAFYGDLHNHCEISYGHGSLQDAFQNARLQLDFASVTAHAHWPDLPEAEARLAAVNAYHLEGFQRALEAWPDYLDATNSENIDGRFTTLLSFEWHSMRSGDHNVYYRGDRGEIVPASDLIDLRRRLLMGVGREGGFVIPHHIGYQPGFRGIDWSQFDPTLSPFVEIMSMHGCAESDEAPYPYLHTMGPRDGRSTMQAGLAAGHRFGVIGSTDHHSAHPGSYGHGRLGVWARSLTREGIWEALREKRAWALTGDRIEVALSVNGVPMGSTLPWCQDREISIDVRGGAPIASAELLCNNEVIQRLNPGPRSANSSQWTVALEMGWGELDRETHWEVDLTVGGGRLRSVEPRFRGREVVSPQDAVAGDLAFSSWSGPERDRLIARTISWINPTITTPGTQGLALEIVGDTGARIVGRINEQYVGLSIRDLLAGARTSHLGGFLTPAFVFHRAVGEAERTIRAEVSHRGLGEGADWYYARVLQTNGQWACSSPIWVDARVR